MRLGHLVLPATIVVLFTHTSGAQPRMRPPEERAKHLQERLELSDEQTRSVEEILKRDQQEIQNGMDTLRGDRPALRKFLASQAAKTDEDIEPILTEKQKKVYEEMKKERRRRRGGASGYGF